MVDISSINHGFSGQQMTQMTSQDKPVLIDSHGQVVPHDGLLGIFPGDAWHSPFFLEDRYYLMCMESMYVYIYICDVCKSLCIQNTKTIMIFKYICIHVYAYVCAYHWDYGTIDLYRHRLVFSEAPFALTMHWLQLWATRFHQTWWNSAIRLEEKEKQEFYQRLLHDHAVVADAEDWNGLDRFYRFLRMNHWHIMLFNH